MGRIEKNREIMQVIFFVGGCAAHIIIKMKNWNWMLAYSAKSAHDSTHQLFEKIKAF